MMVDVDETRQWRWKRFALLVLGLASFIAFFLGIDHGDIHNFDSLMLCAIARNILETGDWWTLHYPDTTTPWFDHPPLGIWGIAIGFLIAGVNATGARIFTCLCGWMTTLTVGAIGWRLRGPWAGFLSGVALLSTTYFVKMVRRPRMDGPLTLFIALAVLGLLITERKRWGWALFGIATGLAIHTKGIVGLAPLLMAPLALWWMGRWRWKAWGFWIACLVALAVPVPWVILHARSQGAGYLQPYFVDRIWGAVKGDWPDPRGPFFYVWMLIQRVGLPWFPLALYGFWRIARRERAAVPVIVWAGAILLAFTLVKHKHPYYMIPLLPACAVSVGLLLDGWIPNRAKKGLAVFLLIASVGAAVVLPMTDVKMQRDLYPDLQAVSRQLGARGWGPVYAYRMPPQKTEAAFAFYPGWRLAGVFQTGEEMLDRAAGTEGGIMVYARVRDIEEMLRAWREAAGQPSSLGPGTRGEPQVPLEYILELPSGKTIRLFGREQPGGTAVLLLR